MVIGMEGRFLKESLMNVKAIVARAKRWALQYRMIAQLCLVLTLAIASFAQSSNGAEQDTSGRSTSDSTTQPLAQEPAPKGGQSKRILWVIPNYRAVSADTRPTGLSFSGKLRLATEDSFDYSSLLVAGFTAGISQAKKQTPEFHQGGAGYARYFWHSFADQAVGNYFTEFVVPYATNEDPRYYTRYHVGFVKRTAYALSRLFVTRTDSGNETFNFSEIVGNGAAAGASDLYYPSQERTWTKTGQKWATQVALDGVFNVMKEFWPDIHQHFFHQ
jgi:hypothetical protein